MTIASKKMHMSYGCYDIKNTRAFYARAGLWFAANDLNLFFGLGQSFIDCI